MIHVRGELDCFSQLTAGLCEVMLCRECEPEELMRLCKLRLSLDEWRDRTGQRGRPPSKELAACAVERAFRGAWEWWAINRPLLLQNVTPFTADISMGTLEP